MELYLYNGYIISLRQSKNTTNYYNAHFDVYMHLGAPAVGTGKPMSLHHISVIYLLFLSIETFILVVKF